MFLYLIQVVVAAAVEEVVALYIFIHISIKVNVHLFVCMSISISLYLPACLSFSQTIHHLTNKSAKLVSQSLF